MPMAAVSPVVVCNAALGGRRSSRLPPLLLCRDGVLRRRRPTRIHFRPTAVCIRSDATSPVDAQVRKCSPLLESAYLSSGNVSPLSEWQAVPDIWKTSSEKFGDQVALVDPHHIPPSVLTYKQLEQEILYFAEGLRVLGVTPVEKVALFADNSCRWLVADQGIMTTGAINVVRGSRSTVEELLQIYNHSDSIALVLDDTTFLNRLLGDFMSGAFMRFIILLWGEKDVLDAKLTQQIPVFTYKEILKLGQDSLRTSLDPRSEGRKYKYEAIHADDIATLVYTSGSTGTPKGVMLTHRNILFQINNLWDIVPAVPRDRFLTMLPPWHAYERSCEYFTLTCGIEQVYTTVKKVKEDLQLYQPHYIISVPLIYETLYSGIKKQIYASNIVRKFVALSFIAISMFYMEWRRILEGKYLARSPKQVVPLISLFEWLCGKLITAVLWPIHLLGKILVYRKIHSAIGLSKAGISGGGSLPLHVDLFFEAIDIKLQNGYGLTETSPVVACRRLACNVIGSVGHPLRHTEIAIVDSETGDVLPAGSKGTLIVRGPQVMKGYYKNPHATDAVLDDEGWFNTGDIGWIAPKSRGRSRQCGGVLVLDGRAKDTIVLSTGENVEPLDLEEAAVRSNLIQQIVVIGQDQRRLGAIIVPNMDEILLCVKRSNPNASDSDLTRKTKLALLHEELRKWTAQCSFQVGPILVVDEPFTIDNGLLTPTMKIRRDKVVAKYKEQIAKMYKH